MFVALVVIQEISNVLVGSTLRSGAWLQVSGSKTFLIQVFFIYPSYDGVAIGIRQGLRIWHRVQFLCTFNGPRNLRVVTGFEFSIRSIHTDIVKNIFKFDVLHNFVYVQNI